MYFHMNKHHKKVMERQKNVQGKVQIAKIFCLAGNFWRPLTLLL